MYYIIVAVIALIMIFIMIEVSYYNKFQLLNIKISEAFNNIDILFEKKLNLLERCINIIKDNNISVVEELEEINNDIVEEQKSLKDYIDGKDKLYKRLRAKN